MAISACLYCSDKVKRGLTCDITYHMHIKLPHGLYEVSLNTRPHQQQYRSNVRLCGKNRSTCSIKQCCFDIVASVDGA